MVTSKPNWEWTIEEEALGRKQNICKSRRTEDQVSREEKNSQGYWTYRKHSFLEGAEYVPSALNGGKFAFFGGGRGGGFTWNIKVAHRRVGGSGRSRGGALGGRIPPSPYFYTKLRPEGRKKSFLETSPTPPPPISGSGWPPPPRYLENLDSPLSGGRGRQKVRLLLYVQISTFFSYSGHWCDVVSLDLIKKRQLSLITKSRSIKTRKKKNKQRKTKSKWLPILDLVSTRY